MTEDELLGAIRLMAKEQGIERLADGDPGRALEAMRAGIYRAHNQVSPERQTMARAIPPQQDQNDE